MKLFYREYKAQCDAQEAKEPMLILHGLFGMSDNWANIAKTLSEDRLLIVPDLRNHGRSGHSSDFSITTMVDDIHELTTLLELKTPIILGHSMGGRVAMSYALKYPQSVSKLIIADMSLRPAELRPQHWAIFDIMEKTPLEEMKSIAQIERYLDPLMPSKRMVWFILKNVQRNKHSYQWKLNYKGLKAAFEQVQENPIENGLQFDEPTLFIRGEESDYILPEDHFDIFEHFPSAMIQGIPNAGHWLHVDQPNEFMLLVKSFL